MEKKDIIKIHQEALNFIDNKPNNLAELISRINLVGVDCCNLGYIHLFSADLAFNLKEYELAINYWKKRINKVSKEKDSTVKFSDFCWWNLQINDIEKKIYGSTNYTVSLENGKIAIRKYLEEGDAKSALFHKVLLAYIGVQTQNKQLLQDSLQHIEILRKDCEIKTSLLYEINGLNGILVGAEKDKSITSLLKSKTEHLLYLHKKRCLNLIDCVKNEH